VAQNIEAGGGNDGYRSQIFNNWNALEVIAAAIVATSVASAAQAATLYDTSLADPPGYYNGAGNPNEGFTVNTINGIELALGVQYRKIGPVHPTSTNVYNVDTGFYTTPADFCSGFCARWNFQFSINLAATGLTLDDINANLTIVNAANAETINFNPLLIADNAGWDGTNTHPNATATDIGAQNSENLSFFSILNPAFNWDPEADGTYYITLSIFNEAGAELGSVSETIVAGAGAAPIPAALPLFAGGLGLIGLLARRRKKKKLAAVSA
jgi:hypothetical protein